MKKTALTLVAFALVGAGIAAYYLTRPTPATQVATAPVTRSDVVDTVGATGTLQAVTTV